MVLTPNSGPSDHSSLEERDSAVGGVQAIETGLRVLAALSELGPSPMLKTLADRAGMSPPKAHRYLVSFCRAGLVARDPVTSGYRLGPLAVRLGLSALRHLDVVSVGSPSLGAIRDALGCTVALAVWGTHGPTFVRVEETEAMVVVSVRPGTVLPLLSSATGRLFGAYLPRTTIQPLMAAELRCPRGLTNIRGKRGRAPSRTEINNLFDSVREAGLARVTGELNPGIHALSAPIFDHAGALCGAITALGDAATFDASLDGRIADILRQSSAAVSRRMGHP